MHLSIYLNEYDPYTDSLLQDYLQFKSCKKLRYQVKYPA